MTAIRHGRVVWHETGTVRDGRALVVAETPFTVLVRCKGTRTAYEVDWGAVYMLGARKRAEQVLRERRERRRIGG